MRVELKISGRYLMEKRHFSFVSIVTIVCILGIFAGVTVFTTVISVMNGFQAQIRDNMLGMRAHIEVAGGGARGLKNYAHITETAKEHPDVTAVNAFVTLPAILQTGYHNALITVQGIPNDSFNADPVMASNFTFIEGEREFTRSNGIFIGNEMAGNYRLSVGSKARIIAPSSQMLEGSMQYDTSEYIVEGVYKTGFYDYDARLIVMPLAAAQRAGFMGNNVSGVAIKTKNYLDAARVAREIDDALEGLYFVSPWMAFDTNLFSALANEKLMMGLVLALIVAIAALNIMTSQVVFVKDKRREIAILKTLGLKPFKIATVFLFEGLFIGLIGTGLGIAGGIALTTYVNEVLVFVQAALQYFSNVLFFVPDRLLHIAKTPVVPEFFPKSVYYLDRLPYILEPSQLVATACIAFLLTLIFSVIPAVMAARLKPAAVLRYE